MSSHSKRVKNYKQGDNQKDQNNTEDTISSLLSLKIKQAFYYDILDDLFYNVKYNNKTIEIDDYQNYKKYISNLLSKYQPNAPELDYSNIHNIKSQGKINALSYSITKMQKNDGRNLKFYDQTLKIISGEKYVTIIASSCVFKGRFSYEVTLTSPPNTIIIPGFTEITSEFSKVKFCGVGNTSTSYGFDCKSCRKIHNNVVSNYGPHFLSMGDVLGVCINLENKKPYIEYFLNGNSLGKCFENIPIGENKAYFPCITLSMKSSVIVNFGGLRDLVYKYPNYIPIDKPISQINNVEMITERFIDILTTNGVAYIVSGELADVVLHMIFGDLFMFLSRVAFRDSYITRKKLFPFLFEDFEKRVQVFDMIADYSEKKECFIYQLLEDLVYEIDFWGYQEDFSYWKKLIELFSRLINYKNYNEIWFRQKDKVPFYLQLIFKPNIYNKKSFEIQLYDFFKKNEKSINEKSLSLEQGEILCREFRNKYKIFRFKQFKGIPNLEKQSNLFKHLIKIMYERLPNNFKKEEFIRTYLFEFYTSPLKQYFFSNFMVSFYFNNIEIFLDKVNKTKGYKTFSLSKYLNKKDRLELFDESIGGSLNNVFNTHASEIKDFHTLMNQKPTKIDTLFDEIIYFTDLCYRIIKQKTSKFETSFYLFHFGMKIEENELIKLLHNFLMNNMLIFTKENAIILSKFAAFLLGYFLYLYKKKILYFLPLHLAFVPLSIIGILEREECFTKYGLDDYEIIDKAVELYIILLNDEYVIHPKFTDAFAKIMIIVVNKRKFQSYFRKKETIKPFFNCIIKSIKSEYCDDICNFVNDLFTEVTIGIPKYKFIMYNNSVEFLKQNKEIFALFYKNFNDYVNQIMTEMTTFLSEINNDIQGIENNNNISMLCQYHFSRFRNSIVIYAFAIENFKCYFSDINGIEYKQFVNFISNISNRFFTIGNYQKIKESLKKDKHNIAKTAINEIILQIFLIFKYLIKNFSLDSDLIHNFVSHPELSLDNFLLILDYEKENIFESKKNEIELFQNNLDSLIQLRKKLKVKSGFTNKDWEEINQNTNICIICYSNDITHHFVPCNHGCCFDCLIQYLQTKNICFLCHQKIIRIKEDENIAIKE